MNGETVSVSVRSDGATDAFGNATTGYATPVDVADVLIQPGVSSDPPDSNRPDGVTVALTLHFPKTCSLELRGAKVTVRGHDYTVVGDPERYMVANTPTRWNYAVEVTRSDG